MWRKFWWKTLKIWQEKLWKTIAIYYQDSNAKQTRPFHRKNLIERNCTETPEMGNRKKDIGSVFLELTVQFCFLLFTSKNNFMIEKRVRGNWKSIYLSINVESMSDTLVVIWSMLLFPLSDWMLIESPFLEIRAYELISMAKLLFTWSTLKTKARLSSCDGECVMLLGLFLCSLRLGVS